MARISGPVKSAIIIISAALVLIYSAPSFYLAIRKSNYGDEAFSPDRSWEYIGSGKNGYENSWAASDRGAVNQITKNYPAEQRKVALETLRNLKGIDKDELATIVAFEEGYVCGMTTCSGLTGSQVKSLATVALQQQQSDADLKEKREQNSTIAHAFIVSILSLLVAAAGTIHNIIRKK